MAAHRDIIRTHIELTLSCIREGRDIAEFIAECGGDFTEYERSVELVENLHDAGVPPSDWRDTFDPERMLLIDRHLRTPARPRAAITAADFDEKLKPWLSPDSCTSREWAAKLKALGVDVSEQVGC